MLERAGGLALAEDGSLRVSVGGSLLALGLEGELRWRAVLVDERDRSISSALLLRDDVSVCSSHHALHFVDAEGRCHAWVDLELHGPLDDSGPAQNFAPSGAVIMTTITGELLSLTPDGRVELLASRLGYDVPPPAIDESGTLVVAGYAGAGLVGLAPDGTRRWRADRREVDLLPTIDRMGWAAAGSINEHASWLVDAAGQVCARVPFEASFASTSAGWFALGPASFAALDGEGRERWVYEGGARASWGGLGPIVTGDERIIVPCRDRLVALDAEGREHLSVALPEGATWIDLAPWGEGRLALALSSGLYVLE